AGLTVRRRCAARRRRTRAAAPAGRARPRGADPRVGVWPIDSAAEGYYLLCGKSPEKGDAHETAQASPRDGPPWCGPRAPPATRERRRTTLLPLRPRRWHPHIAVGHLRAQRRVSRLFVL